MTDYLAAHSRRYCKKHNTTFHPEDGCEFCDNKRRGDGRRKDKRRLNKLETINRMDHNFRDPLSTPKRVCLSDEDAVKVGRCEQETLDAKGYCTCFKHPTKCIQWDCHLWLGKPVVKKEEVTNSG